MPVTPASRRILTVDDTTGIEFSVSPGGQFQVILQGHKGGTWQLQVRTRAGSNGSDWISVGSDGAFDADGIKSMYLNPECDYRITGGTEGAEAYCIPINGGRGPRDD